MRLQQKTALQKVGVLVRAGMMEPPKWYAAAKQVRHVLRGEGRAGVGFPAWWTPCAGSHTRRMCEAEHIVRRGGHGDERSTVVPGLPLFPFRRPPARALLLR